MTTARRIAAALGLLVAGLGPAAALTVERLEVGEDGPDYYVNFVAQLSAPPAAVMAVLQDYARFPELDPQILEARIVGWAAGKPLLYTKVRGCIGLVFCRDMERYERLTETPAEVIAEAVPGRGDLLRGRTVTRVAAAAGGTRVSYQTRFEPNFWLPRWLLRPVMRDSLEAATRAMFANVEQRARRGAP